MFKESAEQIINKVKNKTMTKKQEVQMNNYYLELKKDGMITKLHEAMIFKLSYEKAFSLNGVGCSYSEKKVDDAYDKGFKDAMVKYRE